MNLHNVGLRRNIGRHRQAGCFISEIGDDLFYYSFGGISFNLNKLNTGAVRNEILVCGYDGNAIYHQRYAVIGNIIYVTSDTSPASRSLSHQLPHKHRST